MSIADGGSIYSPETSGLAETDHAIAIRRQEFQQMIAIQQQRIREEQQAIEREREQVARQRAVALRQEAENWSESDRLRSERTTVEHQIAKLKKNEELLAKRELDIQRREDLRRRNRTASTAFVEDAFNSLSPRSVIEHLTHSSARLRQHAMDNISSCITDTKNVSPYFVHFTPQDIAPDILPKLHQLVSSSAAPTDAVMRFVENTVSSPPMARALAVGGQCLGLADYLVENNGFANRIAICALRQMTRMETAVVQPAYDALAQAIPRIPLPMSLDGPLHPSVSFIEEITPKVISDCFNNALWLYVAPLVTHKILSIRKIALRKIAMEALRSDRTRHGLVEERILELLDHEYQSSLPSPEALEWFTELLPLLAEKICRRFDRLQWLLRRLSDPSAKIHAVTVEALKSCSLKEDPGIYNNFAKTDILLRLNEPPTQQSFAVLKLIGDLLPILALPYAYAKNVSRIVAFLDHAEPSISNSAIAACKRIMNSSLEDRRQFYSHFSGLNFTKDSTLKLCDYAMPYFCRDWVAAGNFIDLSKAVQSPHRRVRTPAHRVWHDVIANSPAARAKIVQDGLLNTLFHLCTSEYDDVVVLGAKCCSSMALEVAKAGAGTTKRLLEFLIHPHSVLRQAAIRSVQIIAESGDVNCNVLVSADVFDQLKLFLDSYPSEGVDNAQKILVRLAPFLSASTTACNGLLQLLNSNNLQVENAARAALAAISYTNITYRETLRSAMLNHLSIASDKLVDFSVQAIQDWLGQDLAQLNDFRTYLDLTLHSDHRVRTAALLSLHQKLHITEYHESMEKANLIYFIQALSNHDSSEAANFVAAALASVALTLARGGHLKVVLQLLKSDEPKIKEGACMALEAVAKAPSPEDRRPMLEDDVLEKIIGSHEHLGDMELRLLTTIQPKLAMDYLRSGRIDFIVSLFDHPQESIRQTARKAIGIVVSGTRQERTRLRDVLLPRANGAGVSDSMLATTSECLSIALAKDLLEERDYGRCFHILQHEDSRVRRSMITEFRSYIQAADEGDRRHLVEAEILKASSHESVQMKDDMITFLADCVLPILGPSFAATRNIMPVFPLLQHAETRIRSAAIAALKNGVDSRHGDVKNVAESGIVAFLHPLIDIDDGVRSLFCHILPKVAPFVSVRAEIDIFFQALSDQRENVQEAASAAIAALVKTSETTRLHLYPSLSHCLNDPPNHALPDIAKAVAQSGHAFIANGDEADLIYFMRDRESPLREATVEAIIQLLSKGGSYEHQKLMGADLFPFAISMHINPSWRMQSLKLLCSITAHLSYLIIADEQQVRDLFSLFHDPDEGLTQTIVQTWSGDTRILESPNLPGIFPLLLDGDRPRNPFVSSLVRHLAQHVVPRFIVLKRIDIVAKVLWLNNSALSAQYLHHICLNVANATELEKDRIVSETSFMTALGRYLTSTDPGLRRMSSDIVEVLSNGSALRSGEMMAKGIGKSLASLAVRGERQTQLSSLLALSTLFSTAPDHADELVGDCISALHDILADAQRSKDVHVKTLSLLREFSEHARHSIILEGVSEILVQWLSPHHSGTDLQCRTLVFEICYVLAQTTDEGRKVLIEGNILPVLVNLTESHIAENVISACKIVNALSRTGTYRREILSSGVKSSLEKITSLFHKSSLKGKADKRAAQAAAKEALHTIKHTKNMVEFSSRSPTQASSPSVVSPRPSQQTRQPVPSTVGRDNPFDEPRTAPPRSETLLSRRETRRLTRSVSELNPYRDPMHSAALGTEDTPQRVSHFRSLSDSSGMRGTRAQRRLSHIPSDDGRPALGVVEEERNTWSSSRQDSFSPPLTSLTARSTSVQDTEPVNYSHRSRSTGTGSRRYTGFGMIEEDQYELEAKSATWRDERTSMTEREESEVRGFRSPEPPSYHTRRRESASFHIPADDSVALWTEEAARDEDMAAVGSQRSGETAQSQAVPPSYRTLPSSAGRRIATE